VKSEEMERKKQQQQRVASRAFKVGRVRALLFARTEPSLLRLLNCWTAEPQNSNRTWKHPKTCTTQVLSTF